MERDDPRDQLAREQNEQHQDRTAGSPASRFARPYVVFDTPSAAIVASPASIVSFSGLDTSLTAQGDVHAAAAHAASWVSGQTTSLYTHEGELQGIAANGDLSLQAHTDALEILADQDIRIVSVNGDITITAKNRIEIVGGDSKIVLDGGDIEFITPGAFTVQAATHSWAGPGNGEAALEPMPDSRAKLFHERFRAVSERTGEALAGLPYRIELADGTCLTGRTDREGWTEPVATAEPEKLRLFWLDPEPEVSSPSQEAEEQC